jgi:hypothetical protein
VGLSGEPVDNSGGGFDGDRPTPNLLPAVGGGEIAAPGDAMKIGATLAIDASPCEETRSILALEFV